MSYFQFRQRTKNESGAALIIVLCFVVLIAGLVVAFLFRATTERQVSNASAGGTKVELLTESALGVVVDDLKQEIITNSDVVGTSANPLYVPKTAANAAPVRDESTPNLPNLIRRSKNSDAKSRASAVSSGDVSKNGRSVHLSRWNAHYLLPLATPSSLDDKSPDASFVSPDWVIVTRSGPTTVSSWNKSLADAAPSNTNFAIGRYAYAIYDEGGLLDINAAGYPSISTVDQYGAKGGLAYADLREVLLNSTQIDQIVGWRNYATVQPSGSLGSFAIDANGAKRFLDLATDGQTDQLTVPSKLYQGETDRAVVNRQQLIRLLKGIANGSSQQADLQNALQYLGTFSREVNAPSWSPTVSFTSPYDYKTARFKDDSTVYNPFILNAKVAGAFTRADGSIAVVGEPLVKNRFPLEKLALLEKMQGTSSLSAQEKDDIARYFGLDPVSDSNGYFRHWSYPTTSTTYKHDSGGIMSLNDVAKKNREPDFFEMLQAGILYGSIGRGGARGDVRAGLDGYKTATFVDPDSKTTLQTLRIGANIVDQWDADNYPTTITLTSTGDSVYGIEDLPYINKFLYTATGPSNLTSPYNQIYKFYAAFQLWNPHQAIASNTGAYPAGIQLSPLHVPAILSISDNYQMGLVIEGLTSSGNKTNPTWYWNGKNQAWTSGAYPDYFDDLSSKGVITVPYSTPSADYREPAASPTMELKSMVGIPPDNVTQNGFVASTLLATNGPKYIFFKTSTVYRIQYLDQSGVYRTYGTFVGLDSATAAVPGTGYKQSPWLKFSNVGSQSSPSIWFGSPKADPRTSRFGSGQSVDFLASSANSTIAPGGGTANSSRISSQPPFYDSATETTRFRLDKLAFNAPDGDYKNATNPSYADNDGKIRPADAINSSVSPLNTPANGGTPLRPIILNRPFRSVGELGYVFRDMPWKTLDLFSANSPDGALLDLFSLKENQPILAGRLNPNTRQPKVLAAVLAGALQRNSSSSTVSSSTANAVANAIVAISKQAPFMSRAELVTRIMEDPALANVSTIKTEREAVVRALADGANTRTWNLLIDLIAQVGRYPESATSLKDFVVDGERHVWLHVAIDRYTGKIVDQQVEVVAE